MQVLIVFGGETRVGSFHEGVHDVSYYDPDLRKWETLTLLPGTLRAQAFSAVSLGYDIYITGVTDDRSLHTSVFSIYFYLGGAVNNMATGDASVFYTYLNKWCNVASMQQPRYHHSSVVVNNEIYAVGKSNTGLALKVSYPVHNRKFAGF